jgi:quinol monooxygenase YgiN
MLTLRILTKVDPEKRLEFLQAMKTFRQLSEGDKHSLYNSVDEEDLYCLLMDWDGQKQLDEYLGSSRFQFFSGAASVLGRIVNAEIITAGEVYPLPNLVSEKAR